MIVNQSAVRPIVKLILTLAFVRSGIAPAGSPQTPSLSTHWDSPDS